MPRRLHVRGLVHQRQHLWQGGIRRRRGAACANGSDGEWDDWEDDYVDGSEDGEFFDLYACWSKNMSDEEAAAREKLDAAKTLLEQELSAQIRRRIKIFWTMAQARLTAGSIEGVTVAMKSRCLPRRICSRTRMPASMLDGTLHYKWNDNGTTSSTNSVLPMPTLTLTCDVRTTTRRKSATVALGLDEGKATRSAARTGQSHQSSRRS